MFESIKIESEEALRSLLKESKKALLNSIQNIQYPSILKKKGAILKWEQNYQEIDRLNESILDNISRKAGVYSLFKQNSKKQWEWLYIGQTQSKTARQRIRSHIVWRNKKTESGKFTGSQLDEVQRVVALGKELGFSFVEIHPAPLRHYIEENLIEELSPPWNKHKTTKKQV